MEIPLPDIAREVADKYSIRGREGPERLVEKFDALHARATRTLAAFITSSTNSEAEKSPSLETGFAHIRTYKKAGTEFDYASDPIAPDSIIVQKGIHKQLGDYGVRYFWISDRKDHEGRPYIYYIDEEKDIVNVPYPEQKGLVKRMNWQNPLWKDEFQRLASVDWPPDEDGNTRGWNTIEVWKRGKTKAEKTGSKTQIRKAVLRQEPVAI